MTDTHIETDMPQRAVEFRDMVYADNRRVDEHERQIKELWRRIHSLSDMIEERDQH